MTLKASAGLIKFDYLQSEFADMNEDKHVNADDALQILKISAKLDDARN